MLYSLRLWCFWIYGFEGGGHAGPHACRGRQAEEQGRHAGHAAETHPCCLFRTCSQAGSLAAAKVQAAET